MLIVAAAPARADTTIGSAPRTPGHAAPAGGGCTLAPTAAPPVRRCSGVITRWRVIAGPNPTPVRLQVMRANPDRSDHWRPTVTPPRRSCDHRVRRRGSRSRPAIASRCVLRRGARRVRQDQLPSGDHRHLATRARADAAGADDAGRRPRCGGQRRHRARRRRRRVRRRDAGQLPGVANADQADTDHDGQGDACDDDRRQRRHPRHRPTCAPVRCRGPELGCPRRSPPPPNQPPTARFRTPGRQGARVGPTVQIRARRRRRPRPADRDACSTTTARSASLRAAPYACTWKPTGADVGRATLLASAVDAAACARWRSSAST